MKRGDICFVNLSQDKDKVVVRPVVIIQNDTSNETSQTTIVAAITSCQEISDKVAHVNIDGECLGRPSIILLNQVKSISRNRVMEVVGSVSERELRMIDRALAVSMGM
ncbi:MAG: type II toxin-antitoxin system PemK/MazF family toxin [bacterium]|nr:type II toxin-antitoxin system PemK/MazF family toxin [bacterium]